MNEGSIILVDASSVLNTSFYGNAPAAYKFAKTKEDKESLERMLLSAPDGQPVNGIYTMAKVLERLVSEYGVDHIALAWDKSRDTFRRKLCPEYKANRSQTPRALKSQFILAEQMFEELGYPTFISDDYEADDIIGTLSKKFSDQGYSVKILTKDQDALQLIDQNIAVWFIRDKKKRKEMLEEAGIPKEMQSTIPWNSFPMNEYYLQQFYNDFSPEQIIEWKALQGDSSDNIPGAKGVGDKSAIPLIQEFFDVDGIYDFIENTEEKEAKEFMKELGIKRSPIKKLLEQKEMVYLSKKLATIVCDMEELQGVAAEDLVFVQNDQKRTEWYQKLEFRSLLK